MDEVIVKPVRRSSLLKIAGSVFQTLALLVLLFVVIVSFSAKVPFLTRLGLTFYSITSGSMAPAIPTGSLLYSGPFTLEDLKENDIITFAIKGNGSVPVVVTHRIVSVRKTETTVTLPDGQKKQTLGYFFTTKGDANQENDQTEINAADILGKYRWSIPYLGYLAIFAQSLPGFLFLVILPAAILIVWEITSIILHFKNHYEQKNKMELENVKASLKAEFESKLAAKAPTTRKRKKKHA